MLTKIYAFLLGIALLTTSGCSCWTDQTKVNTPACVAAHDVVDCTEQAVSSVITPIADIVLSFITQGLAVDWGAITTDVENMSLQDGSCLLAEIQAMLNAHPSASPAMLTARRSLNDAFGNYKTKHYGSRLLKFKVKLKDGSVVTL